MTVRLAFSLLILLLVSAYTWIAFADLSFTVSGRLGPGFFPRAIGVTTIALTLYTIFVDVRRQAARDERIRDGGTAFMRDILLFSGYCFALVLLLPYLGGLLAMIVFMFATLFTFNRGATLINVAVSLLLPVALYLLFDVWLNAAFPTGVLPLPW